MSLQYKLLCPSECELLSIGIRRVYGASYPVPEFYDPDYLCRAIQSNRLHCVVAIDSDEQVVACMSTVLERCGDYTADGSALMIAPEYRGQGIVARLGSTMVATYRQLGLGGLHLYALALHDLVQKQSQDAGAVVTGVLPAWFSRQARISGYNYPDTRIGAVTLFMPLAALPQRVCYLPASYRPILATIYQRLNLGRVLATADDSFPKPVRSECVVERKPGNSQLRIVLERVGADFPVLLQRTVTLSQDESFELIYVDISLQDAGVDSAVATAREQGFFFGALMVERCGSDRLRLQRYHHAIAAPEAMVISSDEGRELLDFVASDNSARRA